EPDAHDQHPEQRPADAADQLSAVADGALHLAQPDGIEAAELRRERARRHWPVGCRDAHDVYRRVGGTMVLRARCAPSPHSASKTRVNALMLGEGWGGGWCE